MRHIDSIIDGQEPKRRRCDISIFGIDRRSSLFTTKFAKKARRSRRDFGRVSVIRFLMTKMLKRVQHDGRVGISGVTENVIYDRHPELVSGSLLILGGSITGIAWHTN